jgi:hypothetical protein
MNVIPLDSALIQTNVTAERGEDPAAGACDPGFLQEFLM